MNKQQQTALNMARFIKSQSLTLLEKLDALDADEQAAMRSRLVRERFRQQTSPPGRVSGCRGEALTQSRSDSGVYTGLTMRHQCGLYEKYAMPGVKCRTDA